MDIIKTICAYALPMLFAITIHEAAHAYAAKHFGDPTASMLGRVTLNPLKHIDPIGTIAMPLVLYLLTSGAFLFGYAKPVPVNFGRLRYPKRDMVWVALAGPASNLAQALLWGVLFMVLHGLGLTRTDFLLLLARAGILVNVMMFALNLFPLPPLDGGRILTGLLPPSLAASFARVEPFGFVIVMALMVSGIFSAYWMQPIMEITYNILDLVLTPLTWIFH